MALVQLQARPEKLQVNQTRLGFDSDIETSEKLENEPSALSVQTREEAPVEISGHIRVRLPGTITVEHPFLATENNGQNIARNKPAIEQPPTTPVDPNPDATWGELSLAANNAGRLNTFDEVEQAGGVCDTPKPYPSQVKGFNEQQMKFLKMVDDGAPGGLSLAHGPPGTGKTWFMKQLIRAFTESKKQVMITAPKDRTVSQLATKLGGLAREKNKFLTGDIIVVRLHEEDTELALFNSGLGYERNQAGRPPIFQGMKPLPAGSLAESLHELSRDMYTQVCQDKRVENKELALFSWMQRWLDIKSDGLLEKHRLGKWGYLRDLYDKLKEGFSLDTDQGKIYDEGLNALAVEIIGEADIIACTLMGAADEWVRGTAKPEMIFVDEAGQSIEADLGPIFAYFAGAKYILMGDHHQLPPKVMDPKTTNTLAAQTPMSLLERLLKSGFPSVMFTEQYRMIPPIGDIVSSIFYNGKMKNAPSTKEREMLPGICEYNKEKFGISSPVVLFNLRESREEREGLNQSRYNLHNISFVLNLVTDLVITKSIVNPEDILVLTAYSGQFFQYSLAVRNCTKDNNPMIQKVNWRKIGASQSDVAEVVILDLTVQSSIGIMKDPRILNVGISRARSVLYIVGSDRIFFSRKSGRWDDDWKYMEKLWEHCDKRDIIANIEEKPDCKYVQPWRRRREGRI